MTDLDRWPSARLAAQVIVPLLDLRPAGDTAPAWREADDRARAGFGGFILFGGERGDVARGARRLAGAAPDHPPVLASDLERGLAQQVRGGLDQPPLRALGEVDDPDLARRCGRALGHDARAVGIDWVFAPVLDLADEPRNPIVGTRAFHADPERVARLGAAWIEGLQSTGAWACAKHAPGHGGTLTDSHATLPEVLHDAERLRARDLLPFRAAIQRDVASLMTAHVAYPTLAPDDPDTPASLSPTLTRDLLRHELGFSGLIVTDALIMAGALAGGPEAAARAALLAGADVLLYPEDPEAVRDDLAAWADSDPAHRARLQEAARRFLHAKARRTPPPHAPPEDLAPEVARRSLRRLGPERAPLAAGDALTVIVLDDDAVPGLGHELVASLSEAGLDLHVVALTPESDDAALAQADEAARRAARLLWVVGFQVRAWKERAGLHPRLAGRVEVGPGDTAELVGLCGPEPLDALGRPELPRWVAWGDAAVCQRAVAGALVGEARRGVC